MCGWDGDTNAHVDDLHVVHGPCDDSVDAIENYVMVQ